MAGKRGAILKDALDFFNVYDEYFSIILAEARANDELCQARLNRTPEAKEDEYRFNAIIDTLVESSAMESAKKRTEIGPAESTLNATVEHHFRSMSDSARESFIDILKRAIELKAKGGPSSALEPSPEEDNLDRHYAAEIVDKLPLIVSRAAQLSPIQVSASADLAPNIEQYFREAHNCYLYGFPVACAVLCRAILEAILKKKLPGKYEDSGDRIEEAHAQGILSAERRVWAYEIKHAGDKAIHQYDRFARGDLSGRVEECLLKTRAVVEELLVH